MPGALCSLGSGFCSIHMFLHALRCAERSSDTAGMYTVTSWEAVGRSLLDHNGPCRWNSGEDLGGRGVGPCGPVSSPGFFRKGGRRARASDTEWPPALKMRMRSPVRGYRRLLAPGTGKEKPSSWLPESPTVDLVVTLISHCPLPTSGHSGQTLSLLSLFIEIDFPNGHKVWVWPRPKPGAYNSIQVSHLHGRDPNTWAISCYFPRCNRMELE